MALVVLPLFAAGLLVGAWYVAVARMEAGLAAWAEGKRAEGWALRHDAPQRTGFPWAAELLIPALVLETPARIGWESERVTLRLAVTDPFHAQADFTGRQALRSAGAAAPVQTEALALRVPLLGGETRLSAGRLALPGLAVAALEAHFGPGTLRADARALTWPGLPAFEEPRIVARLSTPWRGSAAAWRAAQGQLRVDEFTVRSGEVSLRLEAQLGLDAQLQPEGNGRMAVTNPTEALGVLTRAGVIPNNLVPTLRAVLALSARPPAEGGAPRLDLPLELRNRRLVAGRVPWVVLPPLDWR